ncbi:MAG: TonB-dependent receptor [Kordiimonadaceae bacterium]|nr:TonB-dependent receptor [Kordiimonadaceae bacterium]MBO6567247.1 TonB-dependent receptor [Kordiimonadaceae bacterium]MBO6963539.1 TonB-dependent receptor [Kordiimonadaceae bacterium]
MNRLFKTTLCSGVALAAMAASVPAVSQEITSSVRGTVTTPAGNPAVGESVTITDTRTGTTRTVTTNANGVFSARGLTVGGPYTIRVDSNQYEDVLITDVFTNLSGTTAFNIALQDANDGIEEITVVASSVVAAQIAVGPGSSFNFADIQSLPSVSRQIRDVIRLDPRVNVQRGSGGEGFGISCLGGNARANAFTIDGARAGDPFGLNLSGNLARSTFPIPFDSVSSTAVEFSPIDVEYGQFTGCNINIVTKSGTNDFQGSAFFLYTGDSLTGSDIEGEPPVDADFDNYNWGAELGGPIIEDKIFFYASYEETDAGGIQNEGPIGAGFLNESGLTLDEANRAATAIQNIFGRDVGPLVRSLPNTSRRFFGRIDWNVTDNHRVAATYARLEEDRLLGDAIGTGRGETTFLDNFQDRGSISDTYSFRLFSDWTENFSTEIRLSRSDVQDNQGPTLGGEAQDTNVTRVAIRALSFANEFFGNDFASGPGIFRSANQLDTRVDQVKVAGDYVTGDHTISFGYELDRLEVFNLFIINATGTVFFDSVEDLEAGNVALIRQNGSFTLDPLDAGADFARNIHSLYAQDEWQVTDNLQIVAGLRYDFYKSNDAPNLNPAFVDRYGFNNNNAYDGLDLWQPRIGLTWELPEQFGQTTLTAGFGRFGGGDPTVFFSNAFQNFGGAIALGDAGDSFGTNDICTDADLQNTIVNGQFQGLPACIGQEILLRNSLFAAEVAATDPDLVLPSQDRFSLGVQHYTDFGGSGFFDDWQVNLDFIYTNNRNSLDFVDLSIAQNGTAPDGRPIFANIDPSAPGCGATLSDNLRTFSNTSAACFDGVSLPQNIVLTNAVNGSGDAYSFSAQFAKDFDVTDTGTISFRAGYAFADVNVGNPATNFTAGSSFENVSTDNFNDVPIGNSVFANKHNIVLNATYRDEFWDGLQSTIGVFFRARSGRPLSAVFNEDTSQDTFGDSDDVARSLLYIPTGPTDPLVQFAPGFDVNGFFQFLEENNLTQYAGGIVPPGTLNQPWNADIDLRFSQEVPTPFEGHLIELSLNFENFLNFIDSGAGVQRFYDQDNNGIIVSGASIDGAQFVFDDFNLTGGIPTNVDAGDTLWRIQFGVKYKF